MTRPLACYVFAMLDRINVDFAKLLLRHDSGSSEVTRATFLPQQRLFAAAGAFADTTLTVGFFDRSQLISRETDTPCTATPKLPKTLALVC